MINFNQEEIEKLELEGFEVSGSLAKLNSETSNTVIEKVIEKEDSAEFNIEIYNKEDNYISHSISFSDNFSDLDKAICFFQDNAIV